MNLCQDVIHEILNYCHYETTASLASVNAYFFNLLSPHPKIKIRKRLKMALDKAKPQFKSYYNYTIFNLKLNDRLVDDYFNYRVVQVDKKLAMLQRVNMLGEKLSDVVIYATLKKQNWEITYSNELGHYETSILNYGLRKHDYGPLITSVNSHYLNYITKPVCNSLSINYYSPELNMMVPVYYKNHFYEYSITFLSSTLLILKIIDTTLSIKPVLECYFNNKWKHANSKYHIGQFGSWKS